MTKERETSRETIRIPGIMSGPGGTPPVGMDVEVVEMKAGLDLGELSRPRFVALLDVLGFKALLSQIGVHDLTAKYMSLRKWTDDLKDYVARPKQIVICGVPCAVFSDSLLLWTEDGDETALSIFGACATLIWASVREGMPLRGAIAFGDAVVSPDMSLFIGQPIVDAYLLEGAQEWIGVSLHRSCLTSPQREQIIARNEVVEWDVPMNTSTGVPFLSRMHALAWHHGHEGVLDLLQPLEDQAGASSKRKFIFTKQFVHECHPPPSAG